MASYKDYAGLSPKCPHCDKEADFAVHFDEHTVGAHGQYEVVCCKECYKVVHMQCFPESSSKAEK